MTIRKQPWQMAWTGLRSEVQRIGARADSADEELAKRPDKHLVLVLAHRVQANVSHQVRWQKAKNLIDRVWPGVVVGSTAQNAGRDELG